MARGSDTVLSYCILVKPERSTMQTDMVGYRQQPGQHQKQAADQTKKPESQKSELPKNATIVIKLGHSDSEG
jgi:hypothetical protein